MKIPKRLAPWIERFVRWAEVCGRIWADYRLLTIGSILVLGSTVLKWVQFPFSHNLSGLKLTLLHDPGINAHLTPFSIGFLGIIVLVLGLVLGRRNYSLLSLMAAILVMLWAITPAQIAFRQPSMLRRLTYELDTMPVLNVFSKSYFLQNDGSPELVPKRLILYSAWGRFNAAWSFLRVGWYLFGFGAILLAIYALARLPDGRLNMTLVVLCLPCAALAIILVPCAIGQHYYTEALLAKAQGRNQEAIGQFRRAMRWDSWHAQDVDLYATIGQLQTQAGISLGSAERQIRHAVELRSASDYEPAIFEFRRAAEASGAIGATARHEATSTRITYGLALYHSGGIGGAVTNWELALTEDPGQIYALLYLARGYYDTGRYQAGIETADRLVKLIKDHSFVVADAYSMAGDCYAKLGNDTMARRYYGLSLASDPILNYWALTGLAGE